MAIEHSHKQQVLKLFEEHPKLCVVPKEQLLWFVINGTLKKIKKDEVFIKTGDKAEYLYIILEGGLTLTVVSNGVRREMVRLKKGEINGVLPFSRIQNYKGDAIAFEDTHVFLLSRQHMPTMVANHYELTEVLVHQMIGRVRSFTNLQMQNEKLISLGKLFAGLAHEINNPTAAIFNSSNQLSALIGNQINRFFALKLLDLSPETLMQIKTTLEGFLYSGIIEANYYEKTQLEAEIEYYFVKNGFQSSFIDPYPLAEFGVTPAELKKILSLVEDKDKIDLLRFIEGVFSSELLLRSINLSAQRLKDMVGSIKNYTYNDGGIDKQPVNIHQSISTILTLLKPKLLAGGIEVDVQFEAKDNTVLGFAGQLTQVFTNLIDNAIDALATTKDPKLTLKTHSNDTYYMISVIDNGPGIPEELQELVFDTFFTTKDINKGSGMGLDIVRRIVENHQAELILNSKPGYTEFLVRFLLQP